MVVSAGIRSSSTSLRTNSKSVFEADGKPTSISFTPEGDEEVEHLLLARGVHRLDERLVAVAQVGRAPDRARGRRRGRARCGRAGRPFRRGGICRTASAWLIGASSGLGSQVADVLLPSCAGAERICRSTLPLVGKEEAKREQAREGRKRSSRVEAIAATLAAAGTGWQSRATARRSAGLWTNRCRVGALPSQTRDDFAVRLDRIGAGGGYPSGRMGHVRSGHVQARREQPFAEPG